MDHVTITNEDLGIREDGTHKKAPTPVEERCIDILKRQGQGRDNALSAITLAKWVFADLDEAQAMRNVRELVNHLICTHSIPVMLEPEPFSAPPETRLDLVEDQHRFVGVAPLAERLGVLGREKRRIAALVRLLHHQADVLGLDALDDQPVLANAKSGDVIDTLDDLHRFAVGVLAEVLVRADVPPATVGFAVFV